MENELVSIIMPIYNEEKYIEDCIDSLLLQNYPKEYMEWIFVDGMSSDNTRDKINKYIMKYPKLIKVLDNPHKTVPYAMNLGIKSSKGKYIIRLDAHASYNYDYISKCVYYLNSTDADNVGGLAETRGKGFVGNAIAKMLSSKFGVGNSQFRINGTSGYVDTVPFGAFRREIFEKLGFYDVRLTRNQDNEMNYRIRKNDGKIYMSSDIKFYYYCRDSIKGISDMAFKNGTWNIITMKLCPGSMGIRHFVPMLFVLSFIILPIMSLIYNYFLFLFIFEILLYVVLDLYFSTKLSKRINEVCLLIFLFPTFHIIYGLGSMNGILKLCSKKYN